MTMKHDDDSIDDDDVVAVDDQYTYITVVLCMP